MQMQGVMACNNKNCIIHNPHAFVACHHLLSPSHPTPCSKERKNISTKMLKDVGMTVPKVEKQVRYIYAATQGMRAVYMQQDKG